MMNINRTSYRFDPNGPLDLLETNGAAQRLAMADAIVQGLTENQAKLALWAIITDSLAERENNLFDSLAAGLKYAH